MITKKLLLQSIIKKYHLDINEAVKWVIKDKCLSIDFMTPSTDVIGDIRCPDFELDDCKLAIYNTKKLLNLIGVCSADIVLEVEKTNKLSTKLNISDQHYTLTYALSDPLLIGKVGTVEDTEWDIEYNLSEEEITNLIKAKSALAESENLMITTDEFEGVNRLNFTFGDEEGHNNKVNYSIPIETHYPNLRVSFNANTTNNIFKANKPSLIKGKISLNSQGLMKLEFTDEYGLESTYFVIRNAQTIF